MCALPHRPVVGVRDAWRRDQQEKRKRLLLLLIGLIAVAVGTFRYDYQDENDGTAEVQER